MSGSTLDIIIALWLVYAMYHGFKKGLIITLTSLIGLALGIYGAIKFAWIIDDFMKEKWDLQIAVLSFCLTFLIILIVVHLIGKAIEKAVNILAMGIFNKIAGALFNGVKMLLISSTLFLIFQQLSLKYTLIEFPKFESSLAVPILNQVGDMIEPFTTELFGDNIPKL